MPSERFLYLKTASEKALEHMKKAEYLSSNVSEISGAVTVMEEAYLRLIEDSRELLREEQEYRELRFKFSEVCESQLEFGWIRLRIRGLLPKRNYNKRTSYFPEMIGSLLPKELLSLWDKGGRKLIVFHHMYDPDTPERDLRDNDNVETKWIIDSLSGHLFLDDGPEYLSEAHYSSYGDLTATDVYIVPEDKMDLFYELIESDLRKKGSMKRGKILPFKMHRKNAPEGL